MAVIPKLDEANWCGSSMRRTPGPNVAHMMHGFPAAAAD